MGVAPMYGAMVGDRYDRDIRGALDAGMYTVWLNVRDESLPAQAPPPHAICHSIVEIPEALEEA